MTESEWTASTDPHAMLDFLRESGRATDRKVRLFACACCRRIWHLLPQDWSRRAVEVAEAFADQEASPQVLETALALARQAEENSQDGQGTDTPDEGHQRAAASAACAAAYAASDLQGLRTAASYAQGGVYWSAVLEAEERAAERSIHAFLRTSYTSFVPPAARVDAREEERAGQARLLREMFGNPFHQPPPVESAWLAWDGGTVLRVAESAYRERHMPAGSLDPVRLAILADALEEAGCTDSEVLGHLRTPGLHIPGCWVLDWVSGRD